MTHAEKCPVCEGRGTVDTPDPAKARTMRNVLTAVAELGPVKSCHGCDGKGWVQVGKGDPGPRLLWNAVEGYFWDPLWKGPLPPLPSYMIESITRTV